MPAEDIGGLRKIIMNLAINMGTGMEYFMNLSLFDLQETIKDYLEVAEARHG